MGIKIADPFALMTIHHPLGVSATSGITPNFRRGGRLGQSCFSTFYSSFPGCGNS